MSTQQNNQNNTIATQNGVSNEFVDSVIKVIDSLMPSYLKDGTKNLIKQDLDRYVNKSIEEIRKDGKITQQELIDFFNGMKDQFKIEIKEILEKIASSMGYDKKIADAMMRLLDDDITNGLKELPKAFDKHIKGEKEVVVNYAKLIVGLMGLFQAGFWMAIALIEAGIIP